MSHDDCLDELLDIIGDGDVQEEQIEMTEQQKIAMEIADLLKICPLKSTSNIQNGQDIVQEYNRRLSFEEGLPYAIELRNVLKLTNRFEPLTNWLTLAIEVHLREEAKLYAVTPKQILKRRKVESFK